MFRNLFVYLKSPKGSGRACEHTFFSGVPSWDFKPSSFFFLHKGPSIRTFFSDNVHGFADYSWLFSFSRGLCIFVQETLNDYAESFVLEAQEIQRRCMWGIKRCQYSVLSTQPTTYSFVIKTLFAPPTDNRVFRRDEIRRQLPFDRAWKLALNIFDGRLCEQQSRYSLTRRRGRWGRRSYSPCNFRPFGAFQRAWRQLQAYSGVGHCFRLCLLFWRDKIDGSCEAQILPFKQLSSCYPPN